MDIIEPNASFDFGALSLVQPVSIHGGAYFTKLENNRKTLYVQCPKSLTRQGFVRSGKKYYCDLMFDQTATGLIQWLESLENRCREILFQRRTDWFENSLEESDIENAFNSCIRVFKSGKFYLVRCYVRNSASGQPSLRVYDERECILQLEDVTSEKQIISILEIQGIKFTSRSFQLELILKQVMVIDDEPVFDNCLIRTSKIALAVEQKEANQKIALQEDVAEAAAEEEDPMLQGGFVGTRKPPAASLALEYEEEKPVEPEQAKQPEPVGGESIAETPDPTMAGGREMEEEGLLLQLEEIPIQTEEGETMYTLKKPNEVYMQLYREAKQKAKEAKRVAVAALLEAKNIKRTYLLEGDGDSDSDFGDEEEYEEDEDDNEEKAEEGQGLEEKEEEREEWVEPIEAEELVEI